jgi:hypothetical protein
MSSKRRRMKRLLNIALLLLPLLLTSVTFGGEADGRSKGNPAAKADFVLTVKGNLISLDAKNASLKAVLEEIGRRMSIEVLALLPEQEKITTEFEAVPLEEAIERLVRNYPHLIVSQEGDRKITRIIALQKSGDPVQSQPAVKGPEKPIKLESRMREEAAKKESPPPEPFRFQFDPSQYGQKSR